MNEFLFTFASFLAAIITGLLYNRLLKRERPISSSVTQNNSVPTSQIGSAPPFPSLFVGREQDLLALKNRLGISSWNARQSITIIRGLPGSGKSTLVSALANDPEVIKTYPDGVLWASLGMYTSLSIDLDIWSRALGIDNADNKDADEVSLQIASALRDRRMLLIIDDVWNSQQAIPFMVGGQECSTIITTRSTSVAREIAPTPNDIYLLSVLSEAASLELLYLLAPAVAKEKPDEIYELAQILEGLPLALQVAGRLLSNEASNGFDIKELLEKIKEGSILLESHAPSNFEYHEITPTISALLKESTDKLDEETRNNFAMLGVFAPQPATFDLDAMKFVWEVNDPKPIVRTLVERGLLEYVPSLKRYQMHSLLVMHAKTLLLDEDD